MEPRLSVVTGPELAQLVARAASGGVIGKARPPAVRVVGSVKHGPDADAAAGFCEGAARLLSSRRAGELGQEMGRGELAPVAIVESWVPLCRRPSRPHRHFTVIRARGNLIDFVLIVF